MTLCENCKKEIKKKKEEKLEQTEETPGASNIFLGALLGAGTLAGGYFLLKKYVKPTIVARTTSPLMESNQNLPIIKPITKKEEENMIQVD